MTSLALDIDALWKQTRPDERGLVPCVTQDLRSRAVLMVAWVSKEALGHTLRTGYATYYSRSRRQLWEKGATSGNRQRIIQVRLDCDGDTLIYLVEAKLPACHEGTDTCFSYRRVGNGWIREPEEVGHSFTPEDDVGRVVEELETVLDARPVARTQAPRSASEAPIARIRGASEAVLEAFAHAEPPRIVDESADLVYQLALALKAQGLGFRQVFEALDRRLGTTDPDAAPNGE